MKAKKLIEVALPIKEISAESVRDKSIRHGHISTLHLWWARRPLPVCRAIVFASLVPDPLDVNCPQAFKDAVATLLGPQKDGILQVDPYKPYTDIPYTSVVDPMEDNLRNRLMMFIGKFSDKCQQNMLAGKSTTPKEQLGDGSLIKWENKNNPKILQIARELIWVAYNSEKDTNVGFETLHKCFNESYTAIKNAEDTLYDIVDRHLYSAEVDDLEKNLHEAIDNFQSQMPSVFDPFAGGGAIPLEAARLGCRSFGNDINPVAHIIEKGSAEFPQKYGKPIIYSENEFERIYGKTEGANFLHKKEINKNAQGYYFIPNQLAFDVEFFANKVISNTNAKCGNLYKSQGDNCSLVYYWARTATCSNPSCHAEIPMLKQFYLSKKRTAKPKDWVFLNPIIKGNKIDFEIKNGRFDEEGWNKHGNITCPCCGSITSISEVKNQFRTSKIKERLLAIIDDGIKRTYRVPSQEDIENINSIKRNDSLPKEQLEIGNVRNFNTPGWGIDTFDGLFSKRQSVFLTTFKSEIEEVCKNIPFNKEYVLAIKTYLAILFDKVLCRNTSFGVWHKLQETVEHPFGRQAIPMVFDYPEMNPFSSLSGACKGQLAAIILYLESENSFPAIFNNVISGDKSQFERKSLTAVITDPPYYDAIAYADLSDFFYVWLKSILGKDYELVFSTPKTPKQEECTALKHHHDNCDYKAKSHFEKKLTSIFDAIEVQTKDVVSIMFAHQSTEAWTTLCNSILGARMNITGSWPMDTEVSIALKADMATLESSVTVACRPSERKGYGDYKEVKRDIERKVTNEIESLYELGFRGADLLTACFGQAVSEFGRYKTVEKSDGSEVSVAELLEMARNAAFDALLKGVQGDDYTKFYIGWLQLNGTGEVDFDDATKFTRVGVNVNINDIKHERLLILEGKKMHIAMAEEHIGGSSVEGTRQEDSPIKQAHRFILLYRESDRTKILRFVRDICPESSSPLWRLLATLKELLPANDDQKQIAGILQNADDFRQHCHEDYKPVQGNLFEDL